MKIGLLEPSLLMSNRYADRVFAPKIQTGKKELACKNCKKIIGTFYIYKKENPRDFYMNWTWPSKRSIFAFSRWTREERE